MSSDDIVTRLRALLEVGTWVSLADWDSTTKQAADEIERLRQMLAELGERHSAQETKHYRIIRELEAQLKAVRGE